LVARLIEEARALRPDWIIALPHWGYEFEYWPDACMRADAHRLIGMGCDVLLGSSPHVLQPVEVVSVNGWDARAPTQIARQEGPPRPGIIAYSLGNLASILPTAGCQVGTLLGLRLSDRTLLGLDAMPTVCRRALGCSFLAARVCLLQEATPLISPSDARAYRRHAERALSPLLSEYLP
jgi:poly-gamma-glutamate synthesis protein (capsule biosynthesis protein)